MGQYDKLNIIELRNMCKDNNLRITGKKNELIQRLEEFDKRNTGNIDQLNKRIQELEETVIQLQETSFNETVVPVSRSTPPTILTRDRDNTFVPAMGYPVDPVVTTTGIIHNNANAYVYRTSDMTQRFVARTTNTTMPNPVTFTTQCGDVLRPPLLHGNQIPQGPQTGAEYYQRPVAAYAPIGATYQVPEPNRHWVETQTGPIGSENSQYMNVRDIVDILPEFDPLKSKYLNAKQFIHRIELLRGAYNWNDKLLLFAVQQKLKGHARQWLDSQQSIYTSWMQFVAEFSVAFPCVINVAEIHIEMSKTRRSSTESPQEYYYKMVALGHRGGLTDREIVTHIINGINDYDLRKKISNEYSFCTQLLHDIDVYTTYNELRPINTRPPRSAPTEKVQATKSHDGRANERNVRCYNCNQHGHFANRCPEPQKRSRRGKTTEDSAPKTPNVNQIGDSTAVVKEIVVNGRITNSFIDPGSSKTLVRRSFANNLGDTLVCHIPLKGFAGGECVATQMIEGCIEVDDVTIMVKMLLVDDDLISENVLLGTDALCQEGQMLIIERNKCRIEMVNSIDKTQPLTSEEQEDIDRLLQNNSKAFATGIADIGKCTQVKMEIQLTTTTPISQRPYRIPFAKRTIVAEIVKDLLKYDIIRLSDSPYASPVVLVGKKNGEHRLCVDYRALNAVTVKTPFPMPIMEEQFAQMAGNKFFTTLDLRMGYHQLEIAETSRKYTAFVTNDGHFEYNRMPFGLVNAPGVFQALMNQLLAKMEPGEALAYLDDVIIPSRTIEEGLIRLEKFLKILQDFGLTLRLDKCTILATQIEHLGHIVSEEGVKPGVQKIIAVREMPTPSNVTELRRFLGLTGFFRKFVPGYALITEPLTKLLRKDNAEFHWGKEQHTAFNYLIHVLCDAPILALYDVTAMHEVHTDASAVGLAGVLLQSRDGKKWQPVSYYSRRCTETESRCHGYELEVLAVVETLERFRIYLLGKQFKLVTDCSAIANTKKQKELKPKIARWWMKLLEYDFEVVHRQGSSLSHVDALSRAPTEGGVEVDEAGFVLNIELQSDDWLLTMQLQDPKLKNIIFVLNGSVKSPQDKQFKLEFCLKNNRLYRKTDDGLRFVVPKAVRWRVMESCHDRMGHFSHKKTLERVKNWFWFPKMTKYVKEYIAACVSCCYNKSRGGKAEGELHLNDIQPIPFASIHIDHLGPFVRSKRGNTHILVISDAFTKAIIVKAVRSTKTVPVIAVLNELTSFFGLPVRITSDRGTAYTSKLFETYCSDHNIQHIKNAVRTPRANGQVERANKIILDYLRTSTDNVRDWDLKLGELQWSVNSQRNSTTNFTPHELIFDYKLRDITQNQLIAALQDDDDGENKIDITEKRSQALQNMTRERQKWKCRFDKKHATPTKYVENDLVVVQHEPPATGESRKLEPRFKGPYIVSRILGNDRYLVENVPGLEATTRKFCSVFESGKIKRWCGSFPNLDQSSDTGETEDDSNDASFVDEPESGVAELSAVP